MTLLEICVDDVAGLAAAHAGGAQRLEVCAALALGGLTPSAGLMQRAARGPLPALAMIRPRAGDFVWSAPERDIMLADIAAARAAGLSGVVIGASLPDGQLDAATLSILMQAAQGLDVTLHRAIDLTPDPVAAMAVCAALGIRRVLSSGGAATAAAGIARLLAMQAAQPGVTVMPGGGITADTVAALMAQGPFTDIHASASVPATPPLLAGVTQFGFQPPGARRTDAAQVARLRAALDQGAGAGTQG